MISADKIQQNKNQIVSILQSVNLPGMKELIIHLKDTDFFTAPASTKYHGAYDGGLKEWRKSRMKILHSADWHLGAYVGPQCDSPFERTANTRKCMDVVVSTAQTEKPDIIIVAGDLFHVSRTFTDRSMTEIRIAIDYLSALGRIAPVMVLFGTPNHDNSESFKVMEEHFAGLKYPFVRFFTSPEIIIADTKSGPIQIAGIPGFEKGYFRAQFPGLSSEEENKVFSNQLSLIVQGLSAQVDTSIPSLLIAHQTVVGCDLDNGQSSIFLQNEVVLEASALDGSNFDLVCMGHIHKAQQVESCGKPVYYAGSIDAFTFNDEGNEKGFYMHEICMGPEGNIIIVSDFIDTPARVFLTERAGQDGIEKYINGAASLEPYPSYENKVIRVLYTCDSETEKALDKKKLERDLYAAGAYYVSEIRPEKIEASVNRERMHERMTVADCLLRYLHEKKYSHEDIMAIDDEAMPIVQSIQASFVSGGSTGLFLPVEISVRNYRSYVEETLNFTDIFFAMVNGKNGIGKSALFMDSIVDCLYEQPREGELTGWIKSGEKSGAITFTFKLGDDTYRVVRTRQRSGKATLALARAFENIYQDKGEVVDSFRDWEDCSEEKFVDTQKKIVNMLGMDADTFRSCVLLMQDQYGRFMEAQPEDRMGVLANLLGLGIYEKLEDEARKELTDVNREIKVLKKETEDLEEALKSLDLLTADRQTR